MLAVRVWDRLTGIVSYSWMSAFGGMNAEEKQRAIEPGAIRVYEKAGMRMIRSVRTRLTDRFFAVREWHFMEARFE